MKKQCRIAALAIQVRRKN